MIRILWFLIFKQGVIGRDKDFRKILSFPYLLIGSGEIFVKFLVGSLSFDREWRKNFGHWE